MLDVVLALAMLVALLPLFVVVLLLLAFAGDGWLERRVRLGRNGRSIVLTRFRELPGGAFGRGLERVGARELPLLLAVLRGRLSFVGPRALPPGTGAGHTGPRRLMAPGLTGPAQRGCDDGEADAALDDAYVANWSLWVDARLLAGRRPKLLTTACRRAARRPRPGAPAPATAARGRRTSGAAARITNGTRKSQMRSVSAFVKPSTRGDRDHRRDRERLGLRCARRQREPRDRRAEDQQERRRGAEQPVRVRPPRRDPDLVDAATWRCSVPSGSKPVASANSAWKASRTDAA